MLARQEELDVRALLEKQPLTARHYIVVLLCLLTMFVDGYDLYIVAKLSPAIARSFGFTSEAMLLTFTLQQIGTAAGAVTIGSLSDRYGRKAMLIVCLACIGVLTLACSFATSLTQLAVLRGVSGIFIGGVVPGIIALVSEITPNHARARFMTIAYVGFTVGQAGAAMVGAWLLSQYGWQIGFWIGTLMPLALLPLIIAYIPESFELQVRRNPADPRIAARLAKFSRELDVTLFSRFRFDSVAVGKGGSLGALLDKDLRWRTPLLWLVFFFALGGLMLVTTWLPAIFFERGGIPVERFSVLSLYNSFGGVLGIILVGAMMDKWGTRRVLPLFCLCNGLAIVALGLSSFGSPASMAALLAIGFFQAGGQAGLGAFAAILYAARIRTTGVGAAFSAGRIGGIALPMLGGLVLATHLPLTPSLMLFAIPAIGSAILLALLARTMPR